jgi:hypothetical protein
MWHSPIVFPLDTPQALLALDKLELVPVPLAGRTNRAADTNSAIRR